MWFIESVIIIIILSTLTFLAGQPLALYLTRQQKILTVENFCLSLLYGTLTISYMYAIGSYSNLPGKYIGPIIVLLIVAIALIFKNKLRYKIQISMLQFLMVCIAVIIISLLPILLYDSIAPFNDTIGYISMSDYLYNHGFLKKYVDPDGLHPLDSTILVLQNTRARMGANFFLAALQSIFELQKSIFIFPVAQTWGMILTQASIVIASRWIFHLKWRIILFITLLTAITFNPLYYSIHYGFNNQLYGSAYFLATLASFTRLIQNSNNQNIKRFLLINAIFISSLILFYPELFLFAVIALAVGTFIPLLRYKMDKKRWIIRLCGLLGLVLLISNIGFIGFLYFLPGQMHAFAGYNITYSTLEFINTALGIMPLQPSNMAVNSLGVVFLILFLFSLYQLIKNQFLRSCIWLSAILTFAIIFAYFNFFVVNPWQPNKIGHSWNLFKIVNWAYPSVIIGLGYGITQLRWKKVVPIMIILACIPVAVVSHPFYFNEALIATRLTKSDHPFESYKQFANEVRALKTDLPIELISDHKLILAYYLSPKPVIADWRNAANLNCLDDKNANIQHSHSHYIIIDPQYVLTSQAKSLPANNALIDSTMPYIKYFKDFYDLETSDERSWRWSKGNCTVGLNFINKQQVKLRFHVLFATTPAKLVVQTSNDKPIEFIINTTNWTPIEFYADMKRGTNILSLKTNIKPIRIGQDTRDLSFAISDLKMVTASTEPHIQYFKDFYNEERSNDRTWRWSSGANTIGVNYNKNQIVRLKFNVLFLTVPAKLSLQVSNNNPIEFIIDKNDRWVPIELRANLKKGKNIISMKTNVKPIQPGQDTRKLSFAVSDFKIEPS